MFWLLQARPKTHSQASFHFPSMNHKAGIVNNGPLEASYEESNPFVSVSLKKHMCYQYIYFTTFKILSPSGTIVLNFTSSKFPAPRAKTSVSLPWSWLWLGQVSLVIETRLVYASLPGFCFSFNFSLFHEIPFLKKIHPVSVLPIKKRDMSSHFGD